MKLPEAKNVGKGRHSRWVYFCVVYRRYRMEEFRREHLTFLIRLHIDDMENGIMTELLYKVDVWQKKYNKMEQRTLNWK